MNKKLHFKEVKEQVEAVHGLKKYLDSVIKDYKTINWDEKQDFLCFWLFFTRTEKLFSYAMVKSEYNGRVFLQVNIHLLSMLGYKEL